MSSPLPLLKAVPLFAGLSPQDLAAVGRIARREEAGKDQVLFSKDARGDSLYVVAKGSVKIFASSTAGKTKVFAYLEAGDFFGEMALLGGGVRTAGAMAVEPSALLVIRRIDFERLLKSRPAISLALLRALCERLARANREIESFSFNSVLGRTAELLLSLSKKYGRPVPAGVRIEKSVSHRELADMTGTAREMISRVLSRLTRAGCIAQDGGRITLTDAQKLAGWIL